MSSMTRVRLTGHLRASHDEVSSGFLLLCYAKYPWLAFIRRGVLYNDASVICGDAMLLDRFYRLENIACREPCLVVPRYSSVEDMTCR